MRPVLPVMALACLLSACESQLAGSLVYVTPYNIDRLDCEELNRRIAAAANAAKGQQDLIDRASGSATGGVIGTVVYGPQRGKAQFDLRRYEEEADRKNCIRAPIALQPGVSPSAPRPMPANDPPPTDAYGMPRLGGH
jgi:hypothetical protein